MSDLHLQIYPKSPHFPTFTYLIFKQECPKYILAMIFSMHLIVRSHKIPMNLTLGAKELD